MKKYEKHQGNKKNVSTKSIKETGHIQRRGPDLYQPWLSLLLSRHRIACIKGLARLSRTPFATLMTIAVIGLSLALPLGLFLLLNNAQIMTQNLAQSTQISLVLSTSATPDTIDKLLTDLRAHQEVAEVQFISPQQGMEEFQRLAEFEEILTLLPDNPLPPIIQIQPAAGVQTTAAVNELVQQLKVLPGVDFARVDMQWVKKINALLEIAHRSALALALLFSLGVILIVGNTVRLSTERYHDELEIVKLLGATNAYVRCPFLYTGFFYGIFGAMLAWLLIDFIVLWLQPPIQELATLYHSAFQLQELGWESIFILLAIGGFLGLIGSYLAVGQHLRTLESEALG